jgi:hypothetical protein
MKTQAKDAVALAMDWLAQLRDEDSEQPGGKPAIDGASAAGDFGDVPPPAPPAGEWEDAAPAAPPATEVWDAAPAVPPAADWRDADPAAPLAVSWGETAPPAADREAYLAAPPAAAHWGDAASVPPPAADFGNAAPPTADWQVAAPADPPPVDPRDADPAAPLAAGWREAAPPAADGREARPIAPAVDWQFHAPAAPPAADWREAAPPAADRGEARPAPHAADWEMPAPAAPRATDARAAAPPPACNSGPAAVPPGTAPGRARKKAPIEITERAAIGDELRIPLAWCEMGSCISHYTDQEALGEADIRARAIAAGWRVDALGRLACPQCQQGDSWFWTAHPVALWDRDTAVAMTTLLAAAVREITGADGAAGVEPGAIPAGKRDVVPGPRPEMAHSPGRGRHRGHPAHPDRAQ